MKGATKARPSVRTRTGGTAIQPGQYIGGSRKGNRLAARQAAHQEYPVAADGSQYTNAKTRAKLPGSTNSRKH